MRSPSDHPADKFILSTAETAARDAGSAAEDLVTLDARRVELASRPQHGHAIVRHGPPGQAPSAADSHSGCMILPEAAVLAGIVAAQSAPRPTETYGPGPRLVRDPGPEFASRRAARGSPSASIPPRPTGRNDFIASRTGTVAGRVRASPLARPWEAGAPRSPGRPGGSSPAPASRCLRRAAGPLQPPRHRPRRPSQLPCGLVVGLALEVAEHDRGPVFLGKLAKGLVEHAAKVPALDLLHDAGGGWCSSARRSGRPCETPPARTASGRSRRSLRVARERECKARRCATACNHAPTEPSQSITSRLACQCQESCLKHVLHVVLVRQEPPADPQNQRPVTIDQLQERVFVPFSGESLEQACIADVVGHQVPNPPGARSLLHHYADSRCLRMQDSSRFSTLPAVICPGRPSR